MVTTRGKQPAAAAQAVTVRKIATDEPETIPVLEVRNTIVQDEQDGTIGSRLRKRRRTGSSPTDRANQPSNSPNVQNTTSPERKHSRTTRPRQSSSHTLELHTNGGHSDSTISSPRSSISSLRSIAAATGSGPLVHLCHLTKTPIVPSQQQVPIDPAFAPAINLTIQNIINHGEHVDSLRGRDEGWENGDVEYSDTAGASPDLKKDSLPILNNLAGQILTLLGKSAHLQILVMITQPDSKEAENYELLKTLFDYTKKVYARHPFLDPFKLGFWDPADIEIIRKANLATFVSSVFGSQEVGFYYLNEHFLDVFVADGSRLLKTQAQLFLDLKTQAYISALTSGQCSRTTILEDLFPADLEERLLSRRPGAKQLAPSEVDFLQRARNRCKSLLEEPDTEEGVAALPDKYSWDDFLKNVSSYTSRHFELLVKGNAPRDFSINGVDADPQPQEQPSQEQMQHPMDQQHHHQDQRAPHNVQLNRMQPSYASPNGQVLPSSNNEISQKAAHEAQVTIMQGYGVHNGQPVLHPQHQFQSQQFLHSHQQAPQPQFHFEHQQGQFQHLHPPGYWQPHMNGQTQMNGHLHMLQHHPGFSDQNGIPYPTQTQPTRVLYERARRAATAKASPTNRRAGTPSQRRPWSTEEEGSLMAGLDRVKGPHWSQILAMYGPGGSIDESLKDRNQVQLKDKARNLKLFFLKSGIEVPYYLQFVTGELKTRAPAQAAKNGEGKKDGTSEESGNLESTDGVISLHGGIVQNGDGPVAEPTTNSVDGLAKVVNLGTSRAVGADGNDATTLDRERRLTPSVGRHQVTPSRLVNGHAPGNQNITIAPLSQTTVPSPMTAEEHLMARLPAHSIIDSGRDDPIAAQIEFNRHIVIADALKAAQAAGMEAADI